MARSAVNAHGVRTGMRRQTPVDRFDEAVGEDESVLDRIAGIVDMPREAITAAIRDEVDREGRVAPGSFNMDPGMRAPDEFTDVTSDGYNEWAKRAWGPGARPGLGVGSRNPSRAEWNAMKGRRRG